MVRLGLAVACGALLVGTAAQAQVTVGASQSVKVEVPDLTFAAGTTGENGKLSGIYAPGGTGVGSSGGSYDTFVTTTPSTVSFEAANIVSGPSVKATSITKVDLTFTNGANAIANGVLESTITPAGLGFYVANIGGAGSCLYSSCSSDRAANFSDLSSSTRGSDELGTVSVKFSVLRDGVAVYDVAGSMTLFSNVDGFYVDDSDLVANLGFLDGFGKSTAAASTKAYGYAWDYEDILINFGALGAFETETLTYVTEVTSIASANCAFNADCLIAFAGFGDPIGRGGGVDSFDVDAVADFFSLASFMDDSVVLSGPALSATGPIGGINFRGATFNLPTFDAANGVLTFVAPDPGAGVPEPSTWAMMILGFGAMGTVLRRRRAAVQGEGRGARA